MRHFFAFYPHECRQAGESAVRELVQLGIQRAAAHGYRARNAVGLYVNLMFILGSRFDEDPQIPWALEQLDDHLIEDPLARIQRVFHSTEEYLQKTAGSDEEFLRDALHRIKLHDFRDPPSGGSEAFATGTWIRLCELYPQKSGIQGAEHTYALIANAVRSASGHGIVGATGRYMYLMNAFLWGVGFDADPLYPWARRLFSGEGIAGETERVDALIRESLAHVERILKG